MQVLVRDNNVDQALKALKKKMQREGIFREMKLRGHYEKPSEKKAREKAPYLNFVPFLFASAKTGLRVNRVLDLILAVDEERQKRITTSEVNEQLRELVARLQPPQAAGREVKLNYATQVQTSPPTIAVFGNHPELVEEHYVRYLHNGFREAWGFTGNPLRILMRRKGGGASAE